MTPMDFVTGTTRYVAHLPPIPVTTHFLFPVANKYFESIGCICGAPRSGKYWPLFGNPVVYDSGFFHVSVCIFLFLIKFLFKA